MDQADLERFINDEVEESLTLDYKSADALGKSDGKKREISKDVSAFANSAGGRIIYGIAEFQEPARRHLPERIDPVNGDQFTKEWLEQVIAGVRPRIAELVITPVRLDTAAHDVAYVLDIPQGHTAHQAADLRYYRRYNFESVPLYDHEIRDINSRGEHPRLEVGLRLVYDTIERHPGPMEFHRRGVERYDRCRLQVAVHNDGPRLAKYVSGFVYIPVSFLPPDERVHEEDIEEVDGVPTVRKVFDNTERDVVGTDKNPLGPKPLYGPSWYSPIHPGTAKRVESIGLDVGAVPSLSDLKIRWSVFADSAPEREGSRRVGDIAVVDRR
ncbi:MAG: ATP-binding protein [Bacillota bacterium]|nr:ATP-binding protein [Bacillota bacterium]